MTVRRGFSSALLAVVLASAPETLVAQWPATLSYQVRDDNRSEGLADDPKSGEAIRLISAIADVSPRETYKQWPKAVRLRFYLPESQQSPDVRIRQTSAPGGSGYYALDNLENQHWKAGNFNEFQWPAEVMARIYAYQYPGTSGNAVTKDDWIARLAVVVRLGPTGGGQVETVAPAALYHSTPPAAVTAYEFSFRTNAAANVQSRILSSKNAEIFSRPPREVDSGSVVTVRWSPTGQGDQSPGWYSLVLDAKFKTGLTQQHVVKFYHQRSMAK